MGLTSDIIRACQWILDHKDEVRDPRRELLAALRRSRAVLRSTRSIARSSSSGSPASSSSRPPATTAPRRGRAASLYSPANDPFVITVGAADLGTSADPERRPRRAVVGLGLDDRRLRKPEVVRSRPVHGRSGAGGLDPRLGAARRASSAAATCSSPARRSRRRSSRARRRTSSPRTGVHAGPGEGRADGHGAAARQSRRRSRRRRRGRR